MATYNGWRNYETWNVALWLQNDEGLYRIMLDVIKRGDTYLDLACELTDIGLRLTPDGVDWVDPCIDRAALEEMMQESA
jgi:hypothetical protein